MTVSSKSVARKWSGNSGKPSPALRHPPELTRRARTQCSTRPPVTPDELRRRAKMRAKRRKIAAMIAEIQGLRKGQKGQSPKPTDKRALSKVGPAPAPATLTTPPPHHPITPFVPSTCLALYFGGLTAFETGFVSDIALEGSVFQATGLKGFSGT